MGERKVVIQIQRLAILRDGLIVSAREIEMPAEVGTDDERERINLKGALFCSHGFIAATESREIFGLQVMGIGVVRIEFQGTSEFLISRRQVPTVKTDVRERGLRFS